MKIKEMFQGLAEDIKANRDPTIHLRTANKRLLDEDESQRENSVAISMNSKATAEKFSKLA